jgi:hypothetical protein
VWTPARVWLRNQWRTCEPRSRSGPFTVVLCPVSDAFLTEDASDAYVDPYDGLVEGILTMTDGEIATLDDLKEGESE